MEKSISRKLLSVCLVFVLCIITVFVDVQYASAETDFTGYTPISSKEDLDSVRRNLSGNYYLTCDIVFTEDDFAEDGAFYNGGTFWEPIGFNSSRAFTGIFDGNGYKICNLKCKNPMGYDYIGLFSVNKGEIRNLNLDGCFFETYETYKYHAGSIAGYNYQGQISNCKNNGFVSAGCAGGIVGKNEEGNISNCRTYGNINGQYAGGIVAENYRNKHASVMISTLSNIIDCENYASIEGEKYAGGIAATNLQGSIGACNNNGKIISLDIAGGITAWNHTFGSVECSRNDGVVEGKQVGGVVGYNYYQGKIRKCYNTGSITGTKETGGIVGYNFNYEVDTISNCYNTGKVELTSGQSNYGAGGIVGYNDDYYSTNCALTNCYNVGVVQKTGTYGYVGAIVGENHGTINHCYYLDSLEKAEGMSYATSTMVKLSSMDMQSEAAFDAFDFTSTWKIDHQSCYPYPKLVDNWMEKEHSWGVWTERKEATCNAKGEEIRTCGACGSTETRETTVDLTSHAWGNWTERKEATCNAKGEETRTCGTCGSTETRETDVDPAAHKYINYIFNKDGSNNSYGTETAECEYGCGTTDTRDRERPINESHFPDASFRAYVADNIDTDKNLKLSPEEIAAVTEIDVSGTDGLRNLEGLRYFVNLQRLDCSRTGIDHLELYNNKELRTLNCNNTNLTQLDEPGLKKVESVSIKNSPLEFIALGSDNLFYLHVDDTKLESIDQCVLTGIKYLNVMNTDISELDLSDSPELRSLFCGGTDITELDLSSNTKLELLGCENTLIKELILSDHPAVDAVYGRGCNLIAFRLSDAYDVSDFDVKYEDGLDFGEPGTLINLKEQNINTIPEGRTEFNLTEWAPNIEAGRISNLQGATLNGTTLTGFKADSQITYTYDCGAGFTMDVAIKVPKRNVSTGISGGYYVPPVQKPTIEVNQGATIELSKDGTSAVITVSEEYEVVDVLLNGVSVGKVTKVEKLKTGDKLTVQTISKTDLQKEAMKTAITETKLAARSKLVTMKSGKKAIKITWYDKSENDLIFDGVEIKRSLKRNSGYGKKPYFVSVTDQYYNTAIKKGQKYYYKVRGFVIIDGEKYYTDWSLKAIRTA